jgi:hypothetical protein
LTIKAKGFEKEKAGKEGFSRERGLPAKGFSPECRIPSHIIMFSLFRRKLLPVAAVSEPEAPALKSSKG